METTESSTSDIPVWLDGTQRWVTGLTKRTTCDDVIYALLYSNSLHETESTDGYAIFEKWREVERPLSARTKLLKVWNFWGQEQPNVQLSMRSVDEYFFPGESSLYLRSRRRHKRSSRLKSRHTSHGRCPVKRGCVECTRLKSLEQLVKLVVCQERKIKDLQERIQHTDRLVHTHEAKIHQHRVEHNGLDYVQNSYLNSQSSSSSSSIDSSVFTTIDLKKVKIIFPESSWQDLEDIMRMCEDIADIEKRKSEELAKLNQQLQEVEKLKQDGTHGLALLQETNAELEETRVEMVRSVTAHITHEYSEKEQDYKMEVLEQQIQTRQQLMLDLQKQLSQLEDGAEPDDNILTNGPSNSYQDYHQVNHHHHNNNNSHLIQQQQQLQQQDQQKLHQQCHSNHNQHDQHQYQHHGDYQQQQRQQHHQHHHHPHHQQHQYETRHFHQSYQELPHDHKFNSASIDFNLKEDRDPSCYTQYQNTEQKNTHHQNFPNRTQNSPAGFVPAVNCQNEIRLKDRNPSPYLNTVDSRSRSKGREPQPRSNSVGRSRSEERIRDKPEVFERGYDIKSMNNNDSGKRNETKDNVYVKCVQSGNGFTGTSAVSTENNVSLDVTNQFTNSSKIPANSNPDLVIGLHSSPEENSTRDDKIPPPKPKPRDSRMKQRHRWNEQPGADNKMSQQKSLNVFLTDGRNEEHVNASEFNQMSKRKDGRSPVSLHTDPGQRDIVSNEHDRMQGCCHQRVLDYGDISPGDRDDDITRSRILGSGREDYGGNGKYFDHVLNSRPGVSDRKDNGYPTRLKTGQISGNMDKGCGFDSGNVSRDVLDSKDPSDLQINNTHNNRLSSSNHKPNNENDGRISTIIHPGNGVKTKITGATVPSNPILPPDRFRTNGLSVHPTTSNTRERSSNNNNNNNIKGQPTKMMARFPRNNKQNGIEHPASLSVKPSQSPTRDCVNGHNTSSFTTGVLQTYDRVSNDINPSAPKPRQRKDASLVSSSSTSHPPPQKSTTISQNDNSNNTSNRGALYHIISDKLNKSKQNASKPLVQQVCGNSSDNTQNRQSTSDDSPNSRSPLYCSSTSSSSTTINAYLSSDETNSSVSKVSSADDGRKSLQNSNERNPSDSPTNTQNGGRGPIKSNYNLSNSKIVEDKNSIQTRDTNSNSSGFVSLSDNNNSSKSNENRISSQQSYMNGNSEFQTERALQAPMNAHQAKSPASRRRGVNPHFCDISKDPKNSSPKKLTSSDKKPDLKLPYPFQGVDDYQPPYTVMMGEEFGNRNINFAGLGNGKYGNERKIDVKTILDKRQMEQTSQESKYYTQKGVAATSSRTGANSTNILLGKNKMEDSNDSNSDTGLSSMHSDETANMETLV